MEFEEIEPSVWKYEKEGDSVEGVLIRKEEEVGPNKSNTYHLEKGEKQVMVWGTTIIDNKMSYVKVGEYVKITYKKTETNKLNQPVKVFKVEKQKV